MHNADLSNAVWRKSSRSNGHTNCVEVAALPNGDAVAAAGARRAFAVRDSKNRAGGALVFGVADWESFVAHVKAGEYDVRPSSGRPSAPGI
ncbi:DUF397 domain-containing protein [Spongiactinospora sp. 9N601]|uniref:DUF397 domain-containing protein n=1 Tax=Spongiactinospora sp. 9N601 TaxID=3375149 RepID=UPI0037A73E93